MAKRFHLENSELIGPVTALEFLHAHLFVGEGPYLSVYEITTGKRIAITRVFSNQRIHCIQVCVFDGFTTIAVCGGKAASVLHFQQCESTSELTLVSLCLLCDWIWDLCFFNASSVSQSLQVGLATGHNAVWLWDIGKNEKFKISQCEEQCILYCARFIGESLETMWLACGTVFNEVLLWRVQDDKNSDGNVAVRKRLSGHDGVIFSVTYNKERKILCSVSDDRSVKVWKLEFHDSVTSVEASTEPLLTLYGHKARLWDCLILSNYIVTIGEDSMCLVWNSNGEIVKKFTGHIGKSIWSLAAGQDDEMIATGGGDGSIRLWSLNDDIKMTQDIQHVCSDIPQTTTEPSPRGIPRCLGFLPNNSILVLTDKGNLYRYDFFQKDEKDSGTWEFLRNEPEFCSYSVAALSPCRTIVALGNIHGDVKLISTIDMSWCPLQMKPYNGKILSLHWVEDHDDTMSLNLFASGPEGNILWWTISHLDEKRSFSCEVKSCFCLPQCRQRWPNCIFIVPKKMIVCSNDDDYTNIPLVFCGDRRGSLHVFKGCDRLKSLVPVHSYLGIHGRNGVTHITCNGRFVYTTGRDGYFRQYELHDTNLHLVDKKKGFKGLEWVDQLNFTSDGDLLVLGFHTVDFVIWSTRGNEILHRVPCGGGHRVWDILYKKGVMETTAMFTYLKKMTVHVHKLPQRNILQTSILQESFHGREATCVRFIGTLGSKVDVHLMVTGSEDTDINIMAYIHGGTQKRFTKIFKCQGHISSVRCLALLKMKPSTSYDYVLFSGGGRAALKCWSVNLSNVLLNDGILNTSANESSHPVCTLLTELPNQMSRYKRKRLQRQIIEGSSCDIRFMSLSAFSLSELLNCDCSAFGIITGCSDGLLRLYAMDSNTKEMKLISECIWHDKCVLSVGHFTYSSRKPRVIAYTADTAGRIAFWDFTGIFSDYVSRNIEDKDEGLDPNVEKCLEEESVQNEIISRQGLDKEESMEEKEELGKDFEGISLGVNGLTSIKDEVIFDGVCKETGDESSCQPFYQHTLHQSGVNCISLVLQDTGQYMLCSGGDDGAITVTLFKLGEANTTLQMESWSSLPVPNAHTSSTTGVKILHDGLILSTSVDQRLKLWKVDIDGNFKMVVTLLESHFVDVADVQDIDVKKDENGLYRIVICGVGLQMITLKSIA